MLTSMKEAVQLFGKNLGVQTPFFSIETLVLKCSVNSSFLITKIRYQFQGYRAHLPRPGIQAEWISDKHCGTPEQFVLKQVSTCSTRSSLSTFCELAQLRPWPHPLPSLPTHNSLACQLLESFCF